MSTETWVVIGSSLINVSLLSYLITRSSQMQRSHRIALAQLEEIRQETIKVSRIRSGQLHTKIVDGDPEAIRERARTTRRDSDDLPMTGHMRPGLKRVLRGGEYVGDDD